MFTKLGVVIPLGGAGEWDDVEVRGAAPVLVDGRVLLYYYGNDGLRRRVGVAASDDGVHFTKLGVVVPLGAAGEFDDRQTREPGRVVVDGRVLLYYTAHDGSIYRVGLAASNDGVHFTKLGVVLPLGAAGEFDDGQTHAPAGVVVDGRVLLYYSGYDGSNYRVGLAASDDGVHLTRLGVVLPLGAAGEFDETRTREPGAVVVDGRVLLYYSGYDGSRYRVGLAASDDGVHFTKLGVVIPLGAAGEFDDWGTYNSAPLLLDGRVLLYYTGYDGDNYRVGLATSDMGV